LLFSCKNCSECVLKEYSFSVILKRFKIATEIAINKLQPILIFLVIAIISVLLIKSAVFNTLSSYITSSQISRIYQPIDNMINYVTTGTQDLKYYPTNTNLVNTLNSYLKCSDASSIYQTLDKMSDYVTNGTQSLLNYPIKI